MLYPRPLWFRTLFRGTKTALLACLLSFPGHAQNETQHESSPLQLEYRDDSGSSTPIAGIELKENSISLYYIGPDSRKVFVKDTSRIALQRKTSKEQLLYQPERFRKRVSSTRTSPNDAPGAIVYTYIDQDEALEAWPNSSDQIVAFLISFKSSDSYQPHAFIDARQLPEKAITKTIHFPSISESELSEKAPYLIAYGLDGPIPVATKSRMLTQLYPLPETWDNPSDQISILRRAARNGRIDVLEKQLPRISLRKNALADLKNYLLYIAAFHGQIDTADYLQRAGADPAETISPTDSRRYKLESEFPGTSLRSSLKATITNGYTKTFELLLENRSKKSQLPNPGSLLTSSLILKRYDIAKVLVQNGANLAQIAHEIDYFLQPTLKDQQADLAGQLILPLIKTVNHNSTFINSVAPSISPAILAQLHAKGAPVDLPDENGNTPLLLAAGYGNIPAVCWLLDHGANLESVNLAGHTALQYAIVRQQKEAAACLIEQGADSNKEGPHGLTPLMFAALFDAPEVAAKLMENGATLNLSSQALDETLIAIASHDLAPILQQALEQGLDETHIAKGIWPLDWMLQYYQAEACLKAIDSSEKLSKTPIQSDHYSLSIQSLDTEWLKRSFKIEDRPKRLSVRCLIDTNGSPHLVQIRNDMPPVSRDLAKHLVETFQLSRNLIPSNSQLILAEFEIHSDSEEFEFPFDIRTQALYAIDLPAL